jgi:methionyl-tRNA formyltransferase
MEAGLDTGDILLSKECDLESGETAGTLHDRLAALAPGALEEALLLLREGCAPRIRQDESAASYAPKLSRASGRLDWSKSAVELERMVRGLHPWPGCTALLETTAGRRVEIKVHRAVVSPGPADPTQLHLPCEGGGVLELLEVQPSGGKRMSQAEFVRGHQILRAVAAGV